MTKKFLIICSGILLLALNALASPLPANQAFQFSARRYDPNTILLKWSIAPGYFLYRGRLQFKANKNKTLTIGRFRLPKSIVKKDDITGDYQVYRHELAIYLPVLGVNPGKITTMIHYQGCADQGFCYPPTDKLLSLSFDNDLSLKQVSIETPPPPSSLSATLTNSVGVWHLFSFFLLGLLLTFTPCVLPMIPIISGIILGGKKRLSTQKAFSLSLIYVLSMSVTYAAFGITLALLGQNLQAVMQKPWVIILFAIIFTLLALSMFGLFELKLPNRLHNKLHQLSQGQKAGSYIGVAIMGILATLIISPCVSAPLVGVLTYIANTGNVSFGASALFMLSLGMGAPLVLIATTGTKFLPRSNEWMQPIKHIIAILLLAVAIYLLSRILSPQIIMVFWSGLLMMSAFVLGAFTTINNKHWSKKCFQGLGFILFVYAILVLVGATRGNTRLFQPLEGFFVTQQNVKLPFKRVTSLREVKVALAEARMHNQPVLIDFYATWCISCKIMERTVLSAPKVVNALKPYLLLKADVTANDADNKQLLRYFNVIAPPTYLFFDAKGKEISKARIVGDSNITNFLKHLNRVANEI